MYIQKKKNPQDTGHNAADGDPVINAQSVPPQSSSTINIPQFLQKVKAMAEEKVEKPKGLPESILKQFRPSLEEQTADAKCKALGDLLGLSPEAQRSMKSLLRKVLTDVEDIARWKSLDLSPETQELIRPKLEEKKGSLQWLEERLAEMGEKNDTMGNPKEEFAETQKDDIIKKEPLTSTDERAVLSYKSSESYKLNEILRDGGIIDQQQQRMMEELDHALPKLPVYRGQVYRRMSFDIQGEEALEAFFAEHQVGAFVEYPAYTSASTSADGYPIEGKLTVTLVIKSESGRNLEGYGNNFEKEIVFLRGSRFFIERVEIDVAGKPVIYMREVTEDGAG